MIWALEGAFGSGKTLSMVKFAREFVETGNYNVVTNTPFSARKKTTKKLFNNKYEPAEIKYIETKEEYYKEFINATHTLFLLDEGGVWLNNYNWKVIPEEVYERFTQVRKADIHFIYTVRHYGFVANKLRMMTDAVIHCSALPRPNRMSLKMPSKPFLIIQRSLAFIASISVSKNPQK